MGNYIILALSHFEWMNVTTDGPRTVTVRWIPGLPPPAPVSDVYYVVKLADSEDQNITFTQNIYGKF